MSIGVPLPEFLHPKIESKVLRIHRRPAHFVGANEPIVDISLEGHILTLCAPEAGKVMRCREVGETVKPGDLVTEVTTVGTPTWEVFVAYRRADSPAHAGRVGEHLMRVFGPGQVFKDVDSLEPGEDVRDVIRRRLQTAFTMVVIIGPQWLASDRIHDPEDLHREEIVTALKRGIHLVPVLVGGAAMPSKDRLPPEMGELVWKQAVEVTEERWAYDIGRLTQNLEKVLAVSPAALRFLEQVPEWGYKGWQWIADNPKGED